MRPVTVAPSRIAAGGSVRPTLTSKVRVTGSACGATSRTRPAAVTAGSSVRLTVISGSAGAERINCAGTSKTASRPSCRASVTIICPACTTSPARGPVAVTVPGASALSSVKLTRSCAVFNRASASSTCDCADCRACFASSNRARVVQPCREKGLHALEMIARLGQLPLGGREIGLRRPQRVALVLRIRAAPAPDRARPDPRA